MMHTSQYIISIRQNIFSWQLNQDHETQIYRNLNFSVCYVGFDVLTAVVYEKFYLLQYNAV
jgi:hypothetical protein